MSTDALLAQSAVDRLPSGAHPVIIEGPSYRQCGGVSLDAKEGALSWCDDCGSRHRMEIDRRGNGL
jgi:hypothetical protein